MALCFNDGEARNDLEPLAVALGKPYSRVEMAIPFMVEMVTKTKIFAAFSIGAVTMKTAGLQAIGLFRPGHSRSEAHFFEERNLPRKPSIFHVSRFYN